MPFDHDQPEHNRAYCPQCNTDRIVEAIHDLKETIMADTTKLTAATDRLTAGIATLDTREASEADASQAAIDNATTAVNTAADHLDALDAPPATPAPVTEPATTAPAPADPSTVTLADPAVPTA